MGMMGYERKWNDEPGTPDGVDPIGCLAGLIFITVLVTIGLAIRCFT